MYKKKIQFFTLTLIAALAVTAVSAADQEEINLPSLGDEPENVMQRDQLRNQLMSTEERSSFRSRIQSASSHQEREKIRIEQRSVLTERAKAQGMSLPHRSQSSDQGMSQRHGGMGSGGGTGRGRGRF